MKELMKILSIGLLLTIVCAGCSHLVIQKECKQVDGEDLFVCKTLKPWE